MKTGACVDCGRPMAYSKKPPPGMCRHHSHDRCQRCGIRAHRDATGAHYTPPPVDMFAVDVVVQEGLTMRLRPVERSIAVDQLTRRGFTTAQIAERLGVTPRSVVRMRAKRRSDAA